MPSGYMYSGIDRSFPFSFGFFAIIISDSLILNRYLRGSVIKILKSCFVIICDVAIVVWSNKRSISTWFNLRIAGGSFPVFDRVMGPSCGNFGF
ncbi:unnamed protein product [Rotaria magnacalcarata]